jgi:hypothetical protein
MESDLNAVEMGSVGPLPTAAAAAIAAARHSSPFFLFSSTAVDPFFPGGDLVLADALVDARLPQRPPAFVAHV